MNFEIFYEYFYKFQHIYKFLIMIFISCILVYILLTLYNYIKYKLNNLSKIFTIINIFKSKKKPIPKIENKDNRDNNRIEEYKATNKIKKIKDYKYKLRLLLKNINRTIYKYKVSKQENYNDRYYNLNNLKDFKNTIREMYNNNLEDKILIQRANVLIDNINNI